MRAAALPQAVTERGVLETWDVQSAEEIPVAPILLNTQVPNGLMNSVMSHLQHSVAISQNKLS